MSFFSWKDRFPKYTEEELEEKRKKIADTNFEKSDYLAIFIAALVSFLPPLILIFLVLYLILRFFIG